jgi:hypothetical protein
MANFGPRTEEIKTSLFCISPEKRMRGTFAVALLQWKTVKRIYFQNLTLWPCRGWQKGLINITLR